MLHARIDYNERIQDSAGLIPADEPVFILRAGDILAPSLVDDWVRRFERMGGDLTTAKAVLAHAHRMRVWQVEHDGGKLPDTDPALLVPVD